MRKNTKKKTMKETHNIHWNNIGIHIGGDTHVYELCDLCKKNCSSKLIRSVTESIYIIKCSQFECRKEYKEYEEKNKRIKGGERG